MMRLPSVEALAAAARRTLTRFPSVLLAALIAAVAGVIGVDGPNDDFWLRLMGTAALAIPLYLALDLLGERRGWRLPARSVGWVVGAALLAWFMIGWFGWSEPVAFGRYAQLSIAFHLLVAVLPFLWVAELQGFWQFNKSLLLRALTTGIYTVVLYAGLAIALLALDNLFGLNVPDESYARLWIVLVFVFNTWVFLGGVPENLPALESSTDYPTGLKVFTQYVLVPLVAVYIVILTLYLAKVVITQVWPSGWIGWLVSSVATAGIFSLLLVHPIAERAENRWMRTYARAFYIALLPSIVMLWLAIWKRIDQYGVTERRYFLAVLSVWLAVVAVYYALRRSRDIRIIPVSLCFLGLVTFAGPWGAYRASESSQVRRLEQLLVQNEILQDGAIHLVAGQVNLDDRREISAILRYLVETHGTGSIAPWFRESLVEADTIGEGTQPSSSGRVEERAQLIAGLMGVDYVGRWESRRPGQFSYSIQWGGVPVPLAGFDVGIQLSDMERDSALLADRFLLRFDSATAALTLADSGERLVALPLVPLLDSAQAARQTIGGRSALSPGVMRLDADVPQIRMAIYVSFINGSRTDDGVAIRNLDLQVLYSVKR